MTGVDMTSSIQLTRLTMANNFTKAVQFGAESMISVRRLGEFFALPEIGETEGDDGPTGASAAGESMAMLPSRRPSKAAIPMARNPSNRSLPPGMSPSISQNLGNSSAGDSPMVVVRGATFAWDVAVSTGMAKPAAAKGPEPVRQQNDGPMPVQSRALNFSIVPARRGGRPTNTGLVNFDPSAVPEQPPSNGASAPAPPLAKTVKGSTTSLVHVPKLRTILSDITLELKPGTLTAIVGPVGAGKSSSILAILGEMVTQRGFVKVNTDKVAYCPQAPWIVSGTVRDNIVFGGEYDEAKFNQVVADCALTRDLTLLPKGADSLIGERGVTLSGGQKARLSLARAVYHDADLYLLDDPLSAVDAAVGRHLFENTILARLTREKKRAVLLVTHQLQFVKHADQILVLEDGHIASRGTWADIVGDPDDPVGTPFIEVLKEFEKNAENGMDVDFDDLAEKRDGEEHQDNVQVVINEPDSEREEDDEDEDLLEDDEAEEELGKNEGTMRIERLSAAPKTPTGMARRLSLAPLPSNIDLVPLTVSDSKKKVVDGQNGTSGELPNGSGSEAPAAKSKTGEASKDEGNKEFVSEDRAVGSVKGGIYLDYFRRGGGPFAVIFLLAFLAIGEALRVSCDWWLSHWTSLSAVDQRDPRNMAIYGGLVAALMFVSLTRAFAFYTITIGSSNKLSRDALRSVLLSPLIWHQTNPHGRVLNRFCETRTETSSSACVNLLHFHLYHPPLFSQGPQSNRRNAATHAFRFSSSKQAWSFWSSLL